MILNANWDGIVDSVISNWIIFDTNISVKISREHVLRCAKCLDITINDVNVYTCTLYAILTEETFETTNTTLTIIVDIT